RSRSHLTVAPDTLRRALRQFASAGHLAPGLGGHLVCHSTLLILEPRHPVTSRRRSGFGLAQISLIASKRLPNQLAALDEKVPHQRKRIDDQNPDEGGKVDGEEHQTQPRALRLRRAPGGERRRNADQQAKYD